MDNWVELLAFGVDAIIFGICSKLYLKYNYSAQLVEQSQRLGINPDYYDLDETTRKYVIYQGTVKAIGRPIRGLYAPDITGVVQRLTIKEHAIARNTSGFWSDQKNIIHESYNLVPFMIEKGYIQILVTDPLGAEILDLDTIYNKFENSSLSVMDHVISFFNGIRQRGIGTTEELLKEGSFMTVIGEMTKGPEGELQLGPSTLGYPYFITSMPVSCLLRNLKESRATYKWLSYLFGGIGIIFSFILAKKWWIARQNKIRDEEVKKRIEEMRKERRKNARRSCELSENEKCVVCKENPKEIIILQCGHVCICEDCSEVIKTQCPVCRATISNKAAAFIS
ncbi:mitochondrial E3 ubiquitin protein ligase 1-like [Cimex lectularius]|uniref:RING-type E3 ubiquitin transferase n=1 Tax=Cimex lectularius TaxID=79782 RepID=A0A8I6RHS2_CIMLE|nr:mitochondrial E3 ubiquitin protein ligase 1-like [Cimex lectularius]XP_014244137.1 mitochondrial E3 ubiquitin protein ligase 1-like [Cimex lectularius]